MNYKDIFKAAILAGEIMAQSGAETLRVEDTMLRILKTSQLHSLEVYATTTGIVASMSDPTIEPITGVARISNRSNNLSRIHEVNQISRNLCDGAITVDEAIGRLTTLRDYTIYNKRILALATIVCTFGFAGLFGGSILDCLIAAVNGLFIVLVGRMTERRVRSPFMADAVKSFLLAFITMLSSLLFPQVNMDLIIIGSIMPLVPGIPITNAIRDTLHGDYNSGTARAVEAFVISLGISFGVGAGLGLFNIVERML